MTNQRMYSIGRFAKMTDVSVKQLRYLEEKGLLIPKVRDANNNYRYYSHSQLGRLVFIKTLRDLGLPFEDIVTILQAGELNVSTGVLQQHLDRINGQVKQLLESYQRSAAYLTPRPGYRHDAGNVCRGLARARADSLAKPVKNNL